MAKVKYPLFSGDVQGQFGKQMIYTRGGVVRRYFRPRDPKSAAQLAVREAFKEFTMAGLTQEQADLLYAAINHLHEAEEFAFFAEWDFHYLLGSGTPPTWLNLSVAGITVMMLDDVDPPHWGVTRLKSHATNANSGRRFLLAAKLLDILNFDYVFDVVFRLVDATDLQAQFGFMYDSISPPSDGVHLRIDGTTIVGRAYNSGVTETVSFDLLEYQWYRGRIEIMSDGEGGRVAIFTIYNDMSGEMLWQETIGGAGLPTSVTGVGLTGRRTSSAGGTAVSLIDFDFVRYAVTSGIVRDF